MDRERPGRPPPLQPVQAQHDAVNSHAAPSYGRGGSNAWYPDVFFQDPSRARHVKLSGHGVEHPKGSVSNPAAMAYDPSNGSTYGSNANNAITIQSAQNYRHDGNHWRKPQVAMDRWALNPHNPLVQRYTTFNGSFGGKPNDFIPRKWPTDGTARIYKPPRGFRGDTVGMNGTTNAYNSVRPVPMPFTGTNDRDWILSVGF